MLTNTRNLRVQWGDCDPAGIIWYPRYFEWFDASTAALFVRAGFPPVDMFGAWDIVGIPMVDTRARFLIPSQPGEELEIETAITEFHRSSFDVRHRVLKGGALAAEGLETRVWTGRDAEGRLKGRPIPREVIARFC